MANTFPLLFARQLHMWRRIVISTSMGTQREFTGTTPRNRALMRVAALSAAAIVFAAVLWAAGMPPIRWLAAIAGLFEQPSSEPEKLSSVDRQAPVPSTPPLPAAEPKREVDGTDSSVSAVPLPLYLLGVSPGRHPAEGTASIGASIDNPQSYAAGAILANGARLTEIHSDYVVLTRGERKARLSLYDRRNLASIHVSDDLLTVGGAPLAAPPRSVSREILTDYLRPSPVYDGELLLGYQVYPGAKATVFRQLGLQPGDVIAAVDDMPLNEPAQSLEMLRQLTEGAALKLTIVRNQSRQHITADGALIVADKERVETLNQAAASERRSL